MPRYLSADVAGQVWCAVGFGVVVAEFLLGGLRRRGVHAAAWNLVYCYLLQKRPLEATIAALKSSGTSTTTTLYRQVWTLDRRACHGPAAGRDTLDRRAAARGGDMCDSSRSRAQRGAILRSE